MDRKDIVVSNLGGIIKRKRNRIIIESGNYKEELNIKYINSLIISGKIAITTDVIKLLISNNIPIIIVSYYGKPIAIINSYDIGGSAINRYYQYKIYDSFLSGEFAKEILRGKIYNQFSNLRYYSKNRKRYDKKTFEILYDLSEKIKKLYEEIDNLNGKIDDIREKLLNIEGKAADLYWQGMSVILNKYGFEKREKEFPKDPINILLNIFYNLLSIEIWKNCLYFSIDPYFGYIHVLRPGKLSFVYDFMEPFRPLIDRFLVSIIKEIETTKIINRDYKYINKIKTKFYEFLERKIVYENKKFKIRYIFWIKCRDFVSFLRNNERFKSFYMYW